MEKVVLVVEDQVKLSEALKAFLEDKGLHVVITATVKAALEYLRDNEVGIVFLDLRLPDGSGLEVLSHLSLLQQRPRIIVISALNDSQTMGEAFERGADEYLTKPFDFAQCFYAAMGLKTVDLTNAVIDPELLQRVPASVAQRYQVIPLALHEGILHLAMADPLDVQRLDELKVILGCDFLPVAVIGGKLSDSIRQSYGMGAEVTHRVRHSKPSSAIKPASGDVQEESEGIVWLVNQMVHHAYTNRATDLHLGVGPEGPWIRERIDGILYAVPAAPQFRELYASVISRIKVMANLDIAEHRLPQDGRILFERSGIKLDLRVSVLPTPRGESLAIRLLEPARMFQIAQLGFTPDQQERLLTLLNKPTGLLLVTGPTGSGKTTSLYAFLTQLNTGRVNIVTIEDPVEHELSGLTQIQVHSKTGLTFATGLRSVLRHDPDIVMVGEIRDQETANLAVRAALTGHLVLSTLHTNDAASGITRLMDLGIEPFLLCSTLIGILSQRLMRQLCEECRTLSSVDPVTLTQMGLSVPASMATVPLGHARGCRKCQATGYHGRAGVFELLVMDHHIRSLILKHTASTQIRQSAVSRGMLTLWQSGWQLVGKGETSLEELIRVVPPELR
ncbi:MAG: Flp pilus assembly complex ATPase component TadA [Candidatus Omnitrophica bacterium]|nr:Flp pilus assembly complex ATPase component TadA [Candidatus Omnitrophota bacterium]MBI3009502.1 Flp pilus assembly complex ATPase component TadA [Candidatus Omnitrophota bacterium]